MTDRPEHPDPDGPVHVLPERALLDPESAGALALSEVLPGMLEPAGEDGAVAVDYKLIVRTVLAAVEDLPRVPRWEASRTVGGTQRHRRPPEPSIEVDVIDDAVALTVDMDVEDRLVIQSCHVAPVDARVWFLAGLAACVEAEGRGSPPT